MRMTSLKLITLRLYMITVGRFAFFSRLIRRALVFMLITQQKAAPYVASSRYFDIRELE